MSIRLLHTADLPALEGFLEEHLESSLFLLHNLRRGGLSFQGRPYQAEYLGAFRDQALLGVAAHTWLNTLLIQTPTLEALDLLEKGIHSLLARPLEGLLGPRDQCLDLMERLNLDRSKASVDLDEPLYRLELFRLKSPPVLQDPAVVVVRPEGDAVEQLAAWRVAFLVEALHRPESPELLRLARAEMGCALAEQRVFWLVAGGLPAACCTFNATTPEMVQVGGVYVAPAFRRLGYARGVVAGALGQVRREGPRQAVVLVDDGNRPALDACEALGFKRVDRYSFTLFR